MSKENKQNIGSRDNADASDKLSLRFKSLKDFNLKNITATFTDIWGGIFGSKSRADKYTIIKDSTFEVGKQLREEYGTALSGGDILSNAEPKLERNYDNKLIENALKAPALNDILKNINDTINGTTRSLLMAEDMIPSLGLNSSGFHHNNVEKEFDINSKDIATTLIQPIITLFTIEETFTSKVVGKFYGEDFSKISRSAQALTDYVNYTLNRINNLSDDEFSKVRDAVTLPSNGRVYSGTSEFSSKESLTSSITNLAQEIGLEVDATKGKKVSVEKLVVANSEKLPLVGNLVRVVREAIEEKNPLKALKMSVERLGA